AELAAVAGARDDNGDAVVVADPPDAEAEPLELLEGRLRRRGPDQPGEDLAAPRPLNGEVVQLVGRGLDPRAQPFGLLLEPDAVVRVAADEAELVVAEPEDGGV